MKCIHRKYSCYHFLDKCKDNSTDLITLIQRYIDNTDINNKVSDNDNDNNKDRDKDDLNKVLNSLKDNIIENLKDYIKNELKTEILNEMKTEINYDLKQKLILRRKVMKLIIKQLEFVV